MTARLLASDRRLEREPLEDLLYPLEPFASTDDFPGRPETCPVCHATEHQHAPGVWDVHRDLLERRARHSREIEARDVRRLCRTCGMVHGPGGCP